MTPNKRLEVVRYPPDGIGASGTGWDSTQYPDPDWAVIDFAIRRLDRDEYPYLWLHTTEPVHGEVPENALCVMGGRGEYAMFLARNGGEVNYYNDARSDTPIRIWESDQGSIRLEKNLCNDLLAVMAIAKHFFEFGQLLPGVCWIE